MTLRNELRQLNYEYEDVGGYAPNCERNFLECLRKQLKLAASFGLKSYKYAGDLPEDVIDSLKEEGLKVNEKSKRITFGTGLASESETVYYWLIKW